MRRNLLLGAATALFFFGLLEALLRLSGRVPTDALRSPDLQTLDAIPGLFQPGQDFVDRVLPELAYRVRINSLGFRGAEFPRLKAAGTVRVLCLGDSYTFGPYVADGETFPAALGRILNEGASPGWPPIEVINGGVSGFTVEDELRFLMAKGFALEPDVILLGYSQNDVLDLARPQPMIDVMRDHAKLKSAFVIGPVVKFLQKTALFNGMQRTAAWIKVRRLRGKASGVDAVGPEQWARYRDLLGRLAAAAREREVRLVLVVWISADQLAGRASLEPQERLAGFARELGLEQVDLAPAIRELAARGVSPYFVPVDGHPNARAYEAAARAAALRLSELGYLSPRS